MDDESDELLATFLEVASGERTAQTRERYAQALDLLRGADQGEPHDGPGARLMMRISAAADEMAAHVDLDPDVRRTAPSLWDRLVRWLARTTDAGGDDARCLVLEAQAAIRRMRARNPPGPAYRTWGDPDPLLQRRSPDEYPYSAAYPFMSTADDEDRWEQARWDEEHSGLEQPVADVIPMRRDRR